MCSVFVSGMARLDGLSGCLNGCIGNTVRTKNETYKQTNKTYVINYSYYYTYMYVVFISGKSSRIRLPINYRRELKVFKLGSQLVDVVVYMLTIRSMFMYSPFGMHIKILFHIIKMRMNCHLFMINCTRIEKALKWLLQY